MLPCGTRDDLHLRSIGNLADEAHDSFATIEELDRAFSAVAPSGTSHRSRFFRRRSRALTNVIALYRPGWSYRPEKALKLLPKMSISRFLLPQPLGRRRGFCGAGEVASGWPGSYHSTGGYRL